MKPAATLTAVAAVFAAAALIAPRGADAQTIKLPETLTLTAYDTGSSGFNIAVAVGKALKDKHGTDVRVLPAGNDVARLAPLKANRAQASAMGIGTYFAQEGVFEFGVKEWGPQPLRLLLAVTDCNAISLGVAKDTGVKEVKDLKGKRIGMVVGSPALNQNAFAVLAFGGLTQERREAGRVLQLRRDVEGHGQQRGRCRDRLDHLGAGEGSRDLAARHRLSADARGRQGRLGAAEQDRPLLLSAQDDLRRRHPAGRIGRAAVLSVSDLHGLCVAAGRPDLQPHQGDDRRTTTPTRTRRRARPASRSTGRTSPGCIPYHEGAVRALKEAGVWKAEHEAHNQKLLKRQETLADAWADVPEEQSARRQGGLHQGLDGGAQRRADQDRPGPGVLISRRGAFELGAQGERRCRPPKRPARQRDRVRRSARAAAPVEAEVTRVRRLAGVWRWLLIVATAATIFLCVNQQFTLRFFVGYTQLNTEYFYLLILCMLPFTFLIFPATSAAPLDRVPWYDAVLFVATVASSAYLMLNIRTAAELGWEFAGAPMPVVVAGLRHVGDADGGAAPHRRLEPAAQRAAVHGLSAVRRRALARAAARRSSRRSSRRPPITCSRTRACSAFRSRPSPRR